jgi:hypothetical protein
MPALSPCRLASIAVLLVAASSASLLAAEPASGSKRHEFTTMIAHLAGYGHPGYIEFVRDARPDVAQFGFYGAHFWGLVHTPQYNGYPSNFPVQGHKECAAWFAEKNRELHKLGVKVVGHMNVKFLVGDLDGPEGPRGFFKFYRDLWDEKVLGPKPTEDIVSMLEVDKHGKPIQNNSYSIGKMVEYWACLNNPNWRKVLKAWVKFGVGQGVDGFVANYFYRHDCHCEHCVRGFKQYLRERHSADQLREQFQIADLDKHVFDEIVGWHKPEESTPLRREMLRFSQIANKRAIDEVFIEYGRSLKPDLMAAQWNHLGYFSQIAGDERCMLPADLWGKGEDYLWYSGGASGCYTDLANHYLGEGTLQARYIRGTFDDKPFTLGKYEHTRLRVTIAELAANGGAPMGLYANYTDGDARDTFVRYYNFMHKLDEVYRANRPHAEVCLLFPRSHVQQRADVAAVAKFKKIGETLLDEHVLFDVRPDDYPPPDEGKYAAVIDATKVEVEQLSSVLPTKRTTVTAPWTVRVSASRPAGSESEIDLHLVNYNRMEQNTEKQPKNPGRGPLDEKPLIAPTSQVQFLVPAGMTLTQAEIHSPEWAEPRIVQLRQQKDIVRFAVPEFWVYAVVRLK